MGKAIKNAGVETPGQLIELGSKEAFLRIRTIDSSACINRLYALEGAIRNIRWHFLSQDIKDELKAFYLSLKVKQ
ncbi:TfoX/Sxy family DNA transformation protein [Thermoanaerobacterium aotearoense]|uniref:TfoX/Sxy family DNA transformation protein n=1 Tax=Thermoanaerobacterium aotearoense TaxID=47490 RepID=UPI003D78DBCA